MSVDIDDLSVSARALQGVELEKPQQPHVDIRAIVGGAAIATAISWVMTSFGAGIGLAAISPSAATGWGAVAVSVAAGLWVLWIAVSSFAVGGYVAARMRRLTYDSSEHERDIRDGAHGLMAWAVGFIALAYLASPAFSGLAKSAALGAATGAAQTANVASVDHLVDRLMRPGESNANANPALRDDMQRSLAVVATTGAMDPADKSYLTQQLSARGGSSSTDTGAQLDSAVAQLTAAREKGIEDAALARRAGVILAFLTGASLILAAATAWRTAQIGGRHRDEQIDLSHLTNWR